MIDEKPCKLPEKEELIKLLKNKKNIIWYMRCSSVEGSPEAKRYLKDQIAKLKKQRNTKQEKKEYLGGL